ncbi:MAG: ORF6N domain-containing protein [Bacteroidetes bacterium]|nr:ORF6N domain-containing protein [Bacteroidota bacterium]
MKNKIINTIILPDEFILSKIYFIRGQKVMIDKNLAELYEVETKVLKQAVRRNIRYISRTFYV